MLNELERCLLSFLIVLCLIITNSIYCPSQNYNIRHLLDSLHTTTNPKIRVRLLWNLADEVQRYNTDSALIVGHQALTIGRSINDMEGISRSLGIIGSVYSRMNNFPKSLQYFFNKRQIDEKSGNVHNLASTLINIGVVYSLQTDFKEALIFFEKADSISRINKLTEMYHHLNINLGNVYEKLKQPDKAVLFYNKALDDALASNDSFNMSISYIGLGNVYSMKGDEYKALNYYNTAIPVIKESRDMELFSEALLGKARIFFDFGDQASALADALNAYHEAQKIGSISRMNESSDFISTLYFKQHSMDSAFAYLKLSKMYGDSLNNLTRLKNIQSLTLNEKIRQNEIAENKRIERERSRFRLQLIFVIILIPAMFLIALLLSKRRVKQSVIKFLGVLSLMFVFEFLTLLLHPVVETITGHNLVIEVIIFVIFGLILVPAHHKIEKILIRTLINNRSRVRTLKKIPTK